MSEGPNTLDRREAVRFVHLRRLWTSLTAEHQLPQLDRWMAVRLKAERGFGRQDRQWYSDALFAMARYANLALFCEWASANDVLEQPPELMVKRYRAERDGCAPYAILRGMPVDRLLAWVGARMPWPSQRRQLCPAEHHWISALAQQATKGPSCPIELLCLWCGLPAECSEGLEKRAARSGWGATELSQFVLMHQTRPPLWLRVRSQSDVSPVVEECTGAGLTVEPHQLALRVAGARAMYSLQSYRDGRFEIQDLASQQIGWRVAAKAGDFVWDCCAGGGGKSLQVAAHLNNSGAVYASDIRGRMLEEIRERARRAGARNLRTFEFDATQAPRLSAQVQSHGGYDWVLVDAPCSGSGTWRRNPDGRLRSRTQAGGELASTQKQLLRRAFEAVRPGGRVVYATCSWRCEENEEVVEQCVADSTGMTLESMELLGLPQHDSDATFTAVIRRDLV